MTNFSKLTTKRELFKELEKLEKRLKKTETIKIPVKSKRSYNKKVKTKSVYPSLSTSYVNTLKEYFEPNELIDVDEAMDMYEKDKRAVIWCILALFIFIILILIF